MQMQATAFVSVAVSSLILLASCAVRYLDRHGFGPWGVVVLAGATVLAVAYASRGLGPRAAWWPTAWVSAVGLVWAALTWTAPSFVSTRTPPA